jgi:anionic cell wall polymer biosynthesis LytR-Cps2A-Psr (LCP) family protein
MTGGDIIEGKDITLSAGEQKLDGLSALMLVRQRKLYDGDGEACRQLITRRLVADAIQYVANQPVSEAKKYTDLLETGSETNMPAAELEAYITAFMNQSNPIAFTLGTGPYETVQDASGKWGIKLEPDKYQALKQAMETGGDMNQIVAPPELV